MLTKAEVCALSDSEYRQTMLKNHPDKNLGCVSEAIVKTQTLNGYRGECKGINLPKEVPTHRRSPIAPKSTRSPDKSPQRLAKANHQFNDFRTRNHVKFYRDVIGNAYHKGVVGTGTNLLNNGIAIVKGVGHVVKGVAKTGLDIPIGAFNITKGVGNGLLGIGRQGVKTLRYGQKSWARMRYRQAKQSLLNCTTECTSIEDCCTKETIKAIQDDIHNRFEDIKREENERREHLLNEAKQYAEIHLTTDDAKEFYKVAEEEIEQDYKKIMNDLQDTKQGGRSRRRRRR